MMLRLTYFNAKHRNASVVFFIFLSLWVAAMLGLILTNNDVFAEISIYLILVTAFTILCFDVMPVTRTTKEAILASRAYAQIDPQSEATRISVLKDHLEVLRLFKEMVRKEPARFSWIADSYAELPHLNASERHIVRSMLKDLRPQSMDFEGEQ